MSKSTVVWMAILILSALVGIASAIWLVIAGFQADENPGGSFPAAPWVILGLSLAAALASTISLIGRARKA